MRNKKLYIICVVLLLSLAFVAVNYHLHTTDDAYSNGKRIGYNSGKLTGYSEGYEKGYDEGYDEGYKLYEAIKDEYEFYHEYAVRVTTTGKKYHRYDCYHVIDRSFYIYNIENAKAKGYTPCLDCFD